MKTLLLFIPVVISCTAFAQPSYPLISTIAFGSCAEENRPQPVLDLVVQRKPGVFIYLGDNIYGDTDDMQVLQSKYDSLAAKPEFQRLKQSTRLLATWDDHDFGRNDAGKHYPFRKKSKEIFLDFFGEPENSDRRNREGIYTSCFFHLHISFLLLYYLFPFGKQIIFTLSRQLVA